MMKRLRIQLPLTLIFSLAFILTLLILQPASPAEAQGGGTVYVAPTSDGGNDGNSCRDHTQPCLTLQRAVDVATGTNEIIYLAGGNYTGSGDQLAYITRNLSIEGGWDYSSDYNSKGTAPSILDGQNARRIFYITDGANVSLIDLQAFNGNASGVGGPGGGIYAISATVSLLDTQINANSATNGGGVYALNSALAFSGVNAVHNNIAGSGGGGVYLDGTSTAVLNSSMSIYSNQAARGGALYVTGAAASLNGGSVATNTATVDGGGFYVAGSGAITLTNSGQIFNNSAGRGGGLYVTGATAYLDGFSVSTNTASTDGGGLYVTGAATVTLNGDIFDNRADNGGGIYLTGAAIVTGGPQIYDNQSDYGGGLYFGGGSAVFNGGVIRNNQANELGGGAYFTQTTAAELNDSQIYNNQASQNGSGVYAIDSGASLRGSVIRDHTSFNGGGLYVEGGAVSLLDGSRVYSNAVNLYGGGVYAISATLVISGARIDANTAPSGGGIYLAGNSTAALTGSLITDNEAKSGQGGGLRLDGSGAVTLTVAGSQITNNRAKKEGAGLYLDGETRSQTNIFLANNTIAGNSIPYSEKVVQVGEITETVIITYTDPPTVIEPHTIYKTVVTAYGGGGVFIRDATANLEGNQFTDNTASSNGGGLYVYSSTVTLINNLIAVNILAAGEQIVQSGDITETLNVYKGSGLYLLRGEANFIHNTIANNVNVNTLGGDTPDSVGVYVDGPGCAVTMFNNIIAEQDIGVWAEPDTVGDGDANVWWQNARNWTKDAFSNDFALHILADPRFEDSGSGDYHLQADSAARDVAVDLSATLKAGQGVTIDIEGIPRPMGFQPDAGAYEHRYTNGLYLDMGVSEQFLGDGSVFTYTVSLKNDGLSDVTGVTFTDTLPAEQTLLDITSAGSSNVCAVNPCNLGDISAGATAVVTLTVRAQGTPPSNSMLAMVNQASVNLPSAQSDTVVTVTTYLQDLYALNPIRAGEQVGRWAGGEDRNSHPLTRSPAHPSASSGQALRAFHNGQCRIWFEGQDYTNIQTAIDAFVKNTNVEGLIKVSGYCGGGVNIRIDPLGDLANKELTIQGGWSTDLLALDADLYPTTFDAGGSGRALQVTGEIQPVLEKINFINGSASSGGGVYFGGGTSAILREVRIANSSANNKGGGIYINVLSVPELDECVIENNSASQGGGGAYLVDSGAVIKNTIFKSNSASDGGGLYLKQSDADINNCAITNHSVSGYGGGIYLDESPAQIQYNFIATNTATVGGGVYAENKSDANLRYNTIQNNRATQSPTFILGFFSSPGGGGGIYGEKSSLLIKNNLIRANTANSGDGAGVHLWNGNAGIQIDNNAIIDNIGGHGVYMRLVPRIFRFWFFFPPFVMPPMPMPPLGIKFLVPIDEQEPVQIRHNTIVNNSGDGVHVFGRTNVALTNNIVEGNQIKGVEEVELDLFLMMLLYGFIPIPIPIPIPAFYPPTVNADYTLWGTAGPNFSVSGAFADGGTSNDLTADPFFMSDGYHIKRISAAYNAGGNTDISSGQDIDGNPRQEGTSVDIGAHEYANLRVRYVAVGGGDTPDSDTRCTDHFNPCGTLADGLTAAWTGDLIKVGRGNYPITEVLLVDKSLAIQGGYVPLGDSASNCDGDCDKWEIPFPALFPTTIQMDGSDRVFTVTGDIETTIAGLHLTGGAAERGGAIYVLSATATISQVWIHGNQAINPALSLPNGDGGAIYFDNSPGKVINSFIYNNNAGRLGGGVFITGSTTAIISATIYNNQAPDGGGVYLSQPEKASLEGGVIRDNQADDRGGGLMMVGGQANLLSVTIASNAAARGGGIYLLSTEGGEFKTGVISANTVAGNGGGAYLESGVISFISNTIAANVAGDRGGGAYFLFSEATLDGNMVAQNRADDGGGVYLNSSSDATLSNNSIVANTAINDGGGASLLSSSSALIGNTISGNSADDGGGLHLDKSPADLSNNVIESNVASGYGGGLHLVSFSFAKLSGNTIALNTSTDNGGGLYMKLSDANMTDNKVLTNTVLSGSGGGVYAQLSNATFMKNTFAANTSPTDGGGLHLDQSQISLQQNQIYGNTATDNGGGLYMLKAGQSDLTANSVTTNTAQNGSGGGLYLEQSPLTILDANTFAANAAPQSNGGGVYLLKSGSPVRSNMISDNSALNGGGLYLNEGDASLEATVFIGNRASLDGGGLFSRKSSPSLQNIVLVANRADNHGSGAYFDGATSTLQHSAIANNSQGDGVGLYLTGQSALSLTNTILSDNGVGINAADGSASLDYTLLYNNATDFIGDIVHTNDLVGDPAFEADGYHITKASEGLDEAAPSKVTTDVDGDSRPQRGAPDLGADEYVEGCYVLLERSGGLTFTHSTGSGQAYAIVQQAVDDADAGDTVKVGGTCDGVHSRQDALTGKTVTQTVYLSKNITLQGGYTFTNWITPDATANPTTLNAESKGRVVYISGNISPIVENFNIIGGKSFGQVGGPSNADAGGGIYVLQATAVISHNTIRDNDGGTYGGGIFLEQSASQVVSNTLIANVASNSGGGMFLNHSAATLANNNFNKNTANKGGGIFLENSAASLSNDTVSTNTVLSAGGGLFLNGSSAVLSATVVFGNQANNGAGLYLDGSAAQIINVRVTTNTADSNGGGIYLGDSAATITGTHFISNTAGSGGGAFFLDSPAVFNGNRFVKNIAKVSGGAVYLDDSPATFVNNIIADNWAENFGSGLYVWESSPSLHYNDFIRNEGGVGVGIYITGDQGSSSVADMKNNIIIMHRVGVNVDLGHTANLEATLWGSDEMWGDDRISNLVDTTGGGTVTTGTVNVREWPGFVNFDAGDYHIFANSPAINVGVDAGVSVDYEGHPRPTDDGFDIGADEYYRVEMAVVKYASVAHIQPGDPLTYTIRVENIGNVDLNIRIADTLPLNIESGGAYSPGQVLTWTAFITRASGGPSPTPGGVWTETVGVTTIVTDSVTLTNVVEVVSDKGVTEIYTSVIVVGAIECEVTIQSTGDGDWDDPATWNMNRVPNIGDEVEILSGHTVTGAENEMSVSALCNSGTLQNTPGKDLILSAGKFILNTGQILGDDGDLGRGSSCGAPGSKIDLRSELIQNEDGGVIRGGNGGDGDQCGGAGGDALALGGDVSNHGVIEGGSGGNVTGTGPCAGGDGGDAIAAALPGTAVNTGQINGGDGGACNNVEQDPQLPGDGGDVKIVADPNAQLTGQQSGGQGGAGAGGDGDDGAEIISTTAGQEVMRDVTLLGPGASGGPPGHPANLPITLLNSGALDDSYNLTQIETNGWDVDALPTPVSVEGAGLRDLLLILTPPMTAVPGAVDQIVITATSGADPGVSASAVINFTVEKPDCNATIQSVGNGDWNNAGAWSLGRPPNSDDVVKILSGHTISAPPIVDIKTLCNEGTLQCQANQALNLNASAAIYNDGQIVCGDGALDLRAPAILNDNAITSDGLAALLGQNVTNNGNIAGVDVLLMAEPGTLKNSGDISGDGGAVKLLADPTLISGGAARVNGDSVVMVSAGLLDLSSLASPAITGSPAITLAGSPINLRDNQDQALIGDPVTLFGDPVQLNTGASLADVAGANAVISGDDLYDVTIFGPGVATGQPEQALPLKITVINSGLFADTYTLSQSDAEGWPLSSLNSPVALYSITLRDLTLTVTLPISTASVLVDVVNATALSPSSGVSDNADISVYVEGAAAAWIYLPVVLK